MTDELFQSTTTNESFNRTELNPVVLIFVIGKLS